MTSASVHHKGISALIHSPEICYGDGEEKRVQDEIIEMLTDRLAKKEKEIELLRSQQDFFNDTQRTSDSRVVDLETKLSAISVEWTFKVDKLTHELDEAHLLVDQLRAEIESQRLSIQNTRRQYERDLEVSRSKQHQLEQQVVNLGHELAVVKTERQYARDCSQSAHQELSMWKERAQDEHSRYIELEHAERCGRKMVDELNKQIETARTLQDTQKQMLTKLGHDKEELENRVERLTRALRDTSARMCDADRRINDLLCSESSLTEQLSLLHTRNEELQAKHAQMVVETKKHQTRIGTLEKSKMVAEASRRDAMEEVKLARNLCREYMFRIKQLDEEVQFLSKKAPSFLAITTPEKLNREAIDDASNVSVVKETCVPSWMRD